MCCKVCKQQQHQCVQAAGHLTELCPVCDKEVIKYKASYANFQRNHICISRWNLNLLYKCSISFSLDTRTVASLKHLLTFRHPAGACVLMEPNVNTLSLIYLYLHDFSLFTASECDCTFARHRQMWQTSMVCCFTFVYCTQWI